MKKRKILAASLAVILAVAMLAGGTFTYLTGESQEVVNTIKPNYNSVELHETDPDTGDDTQTNEYEIVPGTSAVKDPVVTVNYTLDSYVYVVVEDNTNDLVEWMIDNGWTLISDLSDADSGYYVYYQLVTTEDTDAEVNADLSNSSVTVYTKELTVLEGSTISFATDITNEMMLVNGELIENVSLEFVAYIMQASPFYTSTSTNGATEAEGALAAYLAMNNDPSAYALLGYSAMVNGVLYENLTDAVSAAASAGGTSTVTVVADTEISESLVLSGSVSSPSYITLDLNGNSITYVAGSDTSSVNASESLIRITDGVTLTITGDGVIDGTAMDDSTTEHELIYVRGGDLVIESGTFLLDSTKGAVVCTRKTDDGAGSATIYGGTFKNSATSYAYASGSTSGIVLNQVNGNPGDITVYGGVFYTRDPADGDDNLGGSFVAEGYTSTEVTLSDGTAYVVAEDGGASAITVYASEALSFSDALTAADAVVTDEGSVTIVLASSETAYTIESDDVSSLSGVTIVGDSAETTKLDVTALASMTTVENISISDVTFTSTASTSTPSAFKFKGSGTFTNCVFDSENGTSNSAARALTVTGDLTFDNCTFNANVYALNLSADASVKATVTLTNCDVTGWTSFGGTGLTLVVDGCTFHNSGYGVDENNSDYTAYGVLRFYQDATITNCVFDSDFEFIDCATSGKTITISGCTWTSHDIADLLYLADKNVSGVIWTVDGTTVKVTEIDWWS